MKKFNSIFSLVFMAAVLTFTACENKAAEATAPAPAATEAVPMEAEAGPEFTSAYICPMHCEGSGSQAEGKCPVCDMDYVLNEDAH